MALPTFLCPLREKPVRLKSLRTHLIGIRMSSLPIVKDFNEEKHIRFCLRACSILTSMHSLPFQRGKETFRHRIIKAISCATHAAFDSLVLEKLLEVRTGILAAAIAVMYEARSRGSLP